MHITQAMLDALGAPVKQKLRAGLDYILRLDSSTSARNNIYANVLRIQPDGTIPWRAAAPIKGDFFTKIELEHGRLYGTTFGGSKVSIDLHTGRILGSEILKR